jgi:uncharacterized protein YbbC (DUF1343 family)
VPTARYPSCSRQPDGPLLDPACASFVGLVRRTPFCTGMTLGETALFLRDE